METNNIAAMRKALEEIAVKIRKLVRYVLSSLGVATAKPKVLVIDDARYVGSYVHKFLDFCDVEQEYGIPEDEAVLAKYDVLIVDGEGIGNSKYKHGIEFCKAYAKQGNNKGVIYHSGLEPYGEDEQILTKLGVNIMVKGRDPDLLVNAVKEALVV